VWVLSRKTIAVSTLLISVLIVIFALMTLRFIRDQTLEARSNIHFEIHELIDEAAMRMAELERYLSNLLIDNGNSTIDEAHSVYLELKNTSDKLEGIISSMSLEPNGELADDITELRKAIARGAPLLQQGIEDPFIAAAVRDHFISTKKLVNRLRERGSQYGIDHFRAQYDLLEARFATFVLASALLGLLVVILTGLFARQVAMLRQTNQRAVSLTRHLTTVTQDLERASSALEATNTELGAQNSQLVSNKAELGRQNYILQVALTNMQEGLCMVDADERIVIANRQYLAIYRLDPTRLIPGITVDELAAQLVETGLLSPDYICKLKKRHWAQRTQHYPTTRDRILTDGRIIEIHECPLEDGGWLTTHEDVTDLRRSHESARHLASHDP
jgi:PAS domain-containing protein